MAEDTAAVKKIDTPSVPEPAPAPVPDQAAESSSKRKLDDEPAPEPKRQHVVVLDDEEAAMNAPSDTRGGDYGRGRGRGRGRGGGGGHQKSRFQLKKEARERNKAKSREKGRLGHDGAAGGNGDDEEESGANDDAEAIKVDKTAAGDGVEVGDGAGAGDDDERRLPKKRAAVLVGYCGTGYSGMQIQTHGSRTIEGDLFAALVKAGAVSAENAVDHRKVDVQRAARTDAGVHAAGNCISLKMILDPPLPDGFSSLTEYVNTLLPDQIRMWGFVRTMKSFQARAACDSRIYEYLLPSYCLLPPAKTDPLAETLDRVSPGWRDVVAVAAEFTDAAVPPPIPEQPSTTAAEADEGEGKEAEAEGEGVGEGKLDPKARGEFERRRGWRIDAGTLERFRTLVGKYRGTHNFHNYTVGKPYKDKTVKRYMIQLDVRDPVVYGDIEWISVRIHGQSFMLHQIRKMMSLAMLACRTGTSPALIAESFGPKRIHIPKAPPLGLLLEQPQFKTYNERVRRTPTDSEGRDFVDFGKYADEMHKFKVEWIYERLREVELESNVFHKWIRQVDCTASRAFTFLNTQGVIPLEAQVTLTSKKYDLDGGVKRAAAAASAAATTFAEGAAQAGDSTGATTSSATGPGVVGEGESVGSGVPGGDERDDEVNEGLESDDDDVDAGALARGELEG